MESVELGGRHGRVDYGPLYGVLRGMSCVTRKIRFGLTDVCVVDSGRGSRVVG